MQGPGRCLKLFYTIIIVLLLHYFNPSLSLGFNKSGVLGHIETNSVLVRCIEREREALLAFKQGLVVDSDQLFSWGSTDHQKECCTWEGVFCSKQTGHVIKLDMNTDIIYDLQGKMLSPKLFELQHLRYLALGGINFTGSQVPDSIGSLTNLRYLDLSFTHIGGRFPGQVGNLTNLQYLDLSVNQFSNVENLNWLPHLSSLTYLDLSYFNLSNVFDWPEAINKLSKLRKLSCQECDLPSPPIRSTLLNINSSKYLANVDLSHSHLSASSIFLWLSSYNTSLVQLDLCDTGLTGSIPDVFGNMNSLADLRLDYNQFEGADPHSFSRLCSLKSLSLGNNNLSGQFSKLIQALPACAQNSLEILFLSSNALAGSLPDLTNFSSLKLLSLRNNQLSGGIPESVGLMSNLERVDLSMNSLKGVISETHFSKLSKLQILDFSYNPLALSFHSDWVPPFQLSCIYLGSCKVGPHFPKWLQTQKSLLRLDISNAEISDILPSWFWGLCSTLTFVNISHNEIRGTFVNISHNEIRGTSEYFIPKFSYYPQLDLSSNQLEGPIPSALSKAPYLDLSNNKLSGSISFLCASAALNLRFLDLSSNNLSGEVADCWTHLENLVMLDLSYNALSGKIPTTIRSLFSIETLKLRSNRFVGELPSSLKNCTSLIVMDLVDNRLSGPLPRWLGVSFQNLIILMLSSNHFNGSMPSELCHLARIQIFDVSRNNISGSIPKCLNNLTTLAQKENSSLNITHTYGFSIRQTAYTRDYADEAAFIWKGRMYSYKNTLGLVKRIDFSSNRLTGEIPSEITHLIGLVSLNLSRNQLTGEIIPEIGKLRSLDSLDLSRNQIDGKIPTSLAQIDDLGFMDLSYNNLSGEIPIGTQLQSFDPSVYAGNLQLCGPPLTRLCVSEQTVVSNEEDKDELVSTGFYICMGLGFVVGFWGVCGSLLFFRSWRHSYFKFLKGLNDWLYVRVALIKRQLKDG